VNDTTEDGESLLGLAASTGTAPWQLDLVRLCLARGADPNRPEGNGRDSPFTLACRLLGRNPEKISLMLEAGADPNARTHPFGPDGESFTPLWFALLCKNLEAVVMLLRYGASLDSCRGQQSIEGALAEEVTYKIRYAPWTSSSRDYGDLPATLVVLFSGVRRAGSYARYLQLPLCKEVMLLRSRALRRRAAPRDPVLAFVCRAPNEIAWHVLGFWRATSDE
jgi:hypothetical protein